MTEAKKMNGWEKFTMGMSQVNSALNNIKGITHPTITTDVNVKPTSQLMMFVILAIALIFGGIYLTKKSK